MAGDGTTSVTVICGAQLKKCLELLDRGIHATVVSDAFAKAAQKAVEVHLLIESGEVDIPDFAWFQHGQFYFEKRSNLQRYAESYNWARFYHD